MNDAIPLIPTHEKNEFKEESKRIAGLNVNSKRLKQVQGLFFPFFLHWVLNSGSKTCGQELYTWGTLPALKRQWEEIGKTMVV
jgi:hypothetical protein